MLTTPLENQELTPTLDGHPQHGEIRLDRESLTSTSTDRRFAKPTWDYQWVTTKKQLGRLAKRLERSTVFSVDTETAGDPDLSERLCVIQIGLPKVKKQGGSVRVDLAVKGKVYLIDVLALESEAKRELAKTGKEVNPLAPLKTAFEDPESTKIIQHDQFEYGQFGKYKIKPLGVVDIEDTSKQLRKDLPSRSLAALALELLGQMLDKSSQTSGFDKRPFDTAQIDYMRVDAEMNCYIWYEIERYLSRLESEIGPELRHPSIDNLMLRIAESAQERQKLLRGAGIEEEVALLFARRDKYREVLKTRVLPEALAQLMAAREAQGTPLALGEGYVYRDIYGSAYYQPTVEKVLDLEALRSIDPLLPEQILVPKSGKQEILEAIRGLAPAEVERLWHKIFGEERSVSPEDLVPMAQLLRDRIWSEIYRDTSRRTKPALRLQIENMPAEPEVKELAQQIVVSEKMGVEDLLCGIIQADATRLNLLRSSGIANEVGFLNRKIERYQEEILKLLVVRSLADGENGFRGSYEGAQGRASFSTRAVQEVDYSRFAELFPEIFETAVTRYAPQQRVKEALYERGLDPKTADALIGKLYRETGKYGKPQARVYPKYALYYKGLEAVVADLEEEEAEQKVEE